MAKYTTYLPFISGPPIPKAGLAASNDTRLAERAALLHGKLGFNRGWQLSGEVPEEQGGLPYIPCLWGAWYWQPGGNQVRDQLYILDELGPNYNGRLLFLNEPDMWLYGRHGQTEVTPYGAAQLYLHVRTKLPQAKIIGPGLSHIDYQNGWKWLNSFFFGVMALSGQPPEMYAWDTHTYIDNEHPLAIIDAYEAFLEGMGLANQKFFISEWAACTPARLTDMKRAFDGDGRIIGHAYYDQYMATWDGDGRCTMLFTEGSDPLALSALGVAFRDS